MSSRTVDWAAPPTLDTGTRGIEGLRERKKRLMRQQLTDTATEMFMQRGFDQVRVSEVAEACGVSTKTVFNYFPTKEALVLDRLDATMTSLRTGLAQPGTSPVDATLRILNRELRALTTWLASQEDPIEAGKMIKRFGALIDATPSLRAHQSDMMDRFVAVVAELLAEPAGVSPDDPEPQIAATALLGLWRIQFQAVRKYLESPRTPDQVYEAVTADMHRAARVITNGLGSTSLFTPNPKPVRPPKSPRGASSDEIERQ
jgi:AcrR family transcriptional regulator